MKKMLVKNSPPSFLKNGNKTRIIVIVGPTASGKSNLAVSIAKKINGEIISADSRQVYKRLDIGSGKITKKEMRGISHHMLDVVSPKKIYTAGKYKKDGEKSLRYIERKNKIPIVVGGTGFYIDSLLGKYSLPNVEPDEKLREFLSKKSNDELIAILSLLDRDRSKTIDKKNKVRLIRAIEIAKKLGGVPQNNPKNKYDVLMIGIKVKPEILKEKIKTRLLKRISGGMIEEVKELHKRGLSFKRMNELGLEYRYIAKYLKKEMTKEEMIKKLETEIWHYAKRQITWFKRDKSINWIEKLSESEKLVKKFLK